MSLEKAAISKINSALTTAIKVSFTDNYHKTDSTNNVFTISVSTGEIEQDGWIVYCYDRNFKIWLFFSNKEFNSLFEILSDL